ncbi:hypothetical protein K435DRAFT_805648 [Dendrothele bispora CBS 962.96]|uniref:Uncharacterized protein n=1 Tax=Dendrothele bispora (strain CBS 962.96) TaxID=1314807 RepID=A0A4S8LAF2_DENBC|nr:hypothetical protein K435DRAFT_805648 [Dendrothele bispora CBS 962.96]
MLFTNTRDPSPQIYQELDILNLACDRDRLPYPNALAGQHLPWLEAPKPEDQAAFAIAMRLDHTLVQAPQCRLRPEFLHTARFDVYDGELRRTDLATTDCQCPVVSGKLTRNEVYLLGVGIDAWELCIDMDYPKKYQPAPKPGPSQAGPEVAALRSNDSRAVEKKDEGQLTTSVVANAKASPSSISRSAAPAHQPTPSTSIRVPKRSRNDEHEDERRTNKKARMSEGEESCSYLEYEENGKTIIEILD